MNVSYLSSVDSTSNSSISKPDSKNSFSKRTSQKIAIFDWDNTLFCTKYLENLQINYNDIFSFNKTLDDFCGYLKREFTELENAILDLFDELIQTEVKIYIVSNAGLAWINNCLLHFLPELNAFIEESKIKIYSAKNLFSKQFGRQKWKIKCFRKVLLENFPDKSMAFNIVCIGDSNDEKVAAVELVNFRHYSKVKVKFVEINKSPSILSIVYQLNYMKDVYEVILKSKNFLHQLVFDNDKGKMKLIMNQSGTKIKERIKFLNNKRHKSKYVKKIDFLEDSFDEMSQLFEE